MKTKKMLATVLALCLALGTMSACVSAEEEGKTVVNVKMEPLASLSPFGTGNQNDAAIWSVCECLFEMDGFGGEMIPVLADANRGEYGGYDHEDGSSDYTVYIYDYIYDSEGNHITADDVKWSFENQANNYEVDGWGVFEGVDVVDDTTAVFHFKNEIEGLGELENIWCRCFIFSEDAFNESESKFTSDLVATGPYVLTDYVPGVSISLAKNEDYWQTDDSLRQVYQGANVDVINFEMISEETQAVIALQVGDLDLVPEVSSINIEQFLDGGEYGDEYDVYSYQHNAVYYLAPNCSPNSVCGDVNMRRALFYAIDQDALVAALGADTITRVNAFGSELFADYQTQWNDEENYNTICDLDLVQECLDEAGYNGETLTLICSSGSSTEAQVLLQLWQNAGISVQMLPMDQAAFEAYQLDDTAWDIEFNARGSSDYVVNMWDHYYDTAQNENGLTTNFIDDPEWSDLLKTCISADGHTEENINEWWQTCVENAYGMGLYCTTNYIVHSTTITDIVRNDKNQVLPGACSYDFG